MPWNPTKLVSNAGLKLIKGSLKILDNYSVYDNSFKPADEVLFIHLAVLVE